MKTGKRNLEKMVKEIISDKLDVNPKKVKAGSVLIGGLGMDSFGAVELIFELKDKFGIEIPEEDFRKIKTVNDVIEYISNKLSKE